MSLLIEETYSDLEQGTSFFTLAKTGSLVERITKNLEDMSILEGKDLLSLIICDKGIQLTISHFPEESNVILTKKVLGKDKQTLAYVLINKAKYRGRFDNDMEKFPFITLEPSDKSLEIEFKLEEDLVKVFTKEVEVAF